MLQNHWRLWHCAFCKHPPFGAAEHLQNHLQDSHLEDATDDQLRASAELHTSQYPIDSTSSCPLCRELIGSTEEYKRHVGRHLEDIALFALPHSLSANDDEQTRGGRTIKDENDDSSVAGFSNEDLVKQGTTLKLEDALDIRLKEGDIGHNVSTSPSAHPTAHSAGYTQALLPPPAIPEHAQDSASEPTPSTSITPQDGLNEFRRARVAEILSDFRMLQTRIASAPVEPTSSEEYYTEGWAALRQCAADGHHILNASADVTVPVGAGGEEEQAKAELQQ